MGLFDQKNYIIREKMPEWWKNDLFLKVINNYSDQAIKDIIETFFPTLALKQPWMVWKKLPEENDWEYHYQRILEDDLLGGDGTSVLGKFSNDEYKQVVCLLPNTQRDCDGYIRIQLHPFTSFNQEESASKSSVKKIEKLTIKNKNQIITIKDITTSSLIEINTNDNSVLIDGKYDAKKVVGSFKKIKSEPREEDLGQLDVFDDNKITQFIISDCDQPCHAEIYVKLHHPVYVIEQNVRVWSPSAFPLQGIKLYGYFCHENNSKEGWYLLFEKTYSRDERIVYDRFTKEFDCEIFYIEVKYYGIALPIKIGFPQEEFSSNSVFETNKTLDKWGRVFSIPRRYYRTDISKDEERNTYPKYYPYSIEQDYYYEKRLLNEYKYNEEANGFGFIKDTDGNNIAMVEIIDPYIEDLYMYTETIPSIEDVDRMVECPLEVVRTIDNGSKFKNINNIISETKNFSELMLESRSGENINQNLYQSDILECYFRTPDNLKENVEITGMQLRFAGNVDAYRGEGSTFQGVLQLGENSFLYLPLNENEQEPVNIFMESFWNVNDSVYEVGGKNYIFELPEKESIYKKQLDNGYIIDEEYIPNLLKFTLDFINEDEKNQIKLKLSNLKLKLYYKVLKEKITSNLILDKQKLFLPVDECSEKTPTQPIEDEIKINLSIKNIGEAKSDVKDIFLIIPEEFSIIDIDNNIIPIKQPLRLELDKLDINKSFSLKDLIITMGNMIINIDEELILKCSKSGIYDIKLITDDNIISKQVTASLVKYRIQGDE